MTVTESCETGLFRDFPFRESILRDIEAAGYERPTPIQAECIPPALEGSDVIGLAQTGTGKTAAFALPIIHKFAGRHEMCALVLAPTRELAAQIGVMFEQLGHSSGVHAAVVVGGIPIEKDFKALRNWPTDWRTDSSRAWTRSRNPSARGQGNVCASGVDTAVSSRKRLELRSSHS